LETGSCWSCIFELGAPLPTHQPDELYIPLHYLSEQNISKFSIIFPT